MLMPTQGTREKPPSFPCPKPQEAKACCEGCPSDGASLPNRELSKLVTSKTPGNKDKNVSDHLANIKANNEKPH